MLDQNDCNSVRKLVSQTHSSVNKRTTLLNEKGLVLLIIIENNLDTFKFTYHF